MKISSRRAAVVAVTTFALVAGPAVWASATLPGRNGLIALRADIGAGYQIYTIEGDGTDLRQLTHLPGDALQPHWSPQGGRITFEFDPATPQNNDFCNVALVNRNGGDVKILPLANGDQCEAAPTFSADGQRLFYEGFNGVSRDAIFSMDLNGEHRRFITSCRGQGVTDPEVSPDGTMLSFTCSSNVGTALFDAHIDGSHLRQLTPYSVNVGSKADWSPDGRHIMFISTANEGTPGAQVNIMTIRPNGSDLFRVTHYAAGGPLAYGNSYSPDGRWILLRLERNGEYALCKVQPNGTELTQITPFSTFRPRGMAWGSAAPR